MVAEKLYEESSSDSPSQEGKYYYVIGFFISFFGGILGMDRFYRGQTLLAFLKLVTGGGFWLLGPRR